MIVDLSSENFSIVKEISAVDELCDPQLYVMTGVNSQIITEISSDKYISDCNIYRTYSEIDLLELDRIE